MKPHCYLALLFPITLSAVEPAWPDWNGPNENWSADETQFEWVDSLADAKLVWQSEEVTPLGKANAARSHGFEGGRHGEKQDRLPSGGGASPVVGGGMVYLSYYVPSGDVFATERNPKKNDDYHRVGADDVVLAIDAKTGKTAWKQVFPGGLNIQERKSPGYSGLTPVFANGRVYAVGTTQRIRCLDAKSGELIWETPTPEATAETEAKRDEALAAKKMILSPFLDNRGGKNLNFADGVLLAHRRGDLLGIDGENGEVLWTLRNALGNQVSPLIWTHEGKERVVAVSREGAIRCLDPRSGEPIWEAQAGAPNADTPAISGDWLVAKGQQLPTKDKRGKDTLIQTAAGFRLSLTGCEKVWTVDEVKYRWFEGQPAIHGGRVYLRGRSFKLMAFDLETGEVIGDVEFPSNGSNASLIFVNGRLLSDVDGSHMDSEFVMFDADLERFAQIGEKWRPPHPNTTSYGPTMTHPVVGGRWFIRGADGVYCYDLRKPQND